MHTRKDETFYLPEGIVPFRIGNTVIEGVGGQAVSGPRNIEYQFTIQSKKARMLTLIKPGDFVNFFLEFSQPTDEEPTSLQASQSPPPAELLARLIARITKRFGAQFV